MPVCRAKDGTAWENPENPSPYAAASTVRMNFAFLVFTAASFVSERPS
jgi:hypothetical protein